MAPRFVSECNSTTMHQSRSKVTYDRRPMKKSTSPRSPMAQNRRFSTENGRRPNNHRISRRSDTYAIRRGSFRSQKENRSVFHQRHHSANGQQRQNRRPIQCRSDFYANRREPPRPKNFHNATTTIHKKQATAKRSPTHRRPKNQKTEVKPTLEDLDRELELYMKKPVTA